MKPKCDEEKSNLEVKPKTLPSKRKVEVLDDKMIEETLLKKKKPLLVDTLQKAERAKTTDGDNLETDENEIQKNVKVARRDAEDTINSKDSREESQVMKVDEVNNRKLVFDEKDKLEEIKETGLSQNVMDVMQKMLAELK